MSWFNKIFGISSRLVNFFIILLLSCLSGQTQLFAKINLETGTIQESTEHSLADFININNIKGYFFANEIKLPNPIERILIPNKSYKFFLLVLKDIQTPVTITSDDLESMKLVDSNKREVSCSMFSFMSPDSNGQLIAIRTSKTIIQCKENISSLDISFLFVVFHDYGELMLKYKNKEINLKSINPVSAEEFSECSAELNEGATIAGFISHTHPKGTAVLNMKDINPLDYSVTVEEIDTSSSSRYIRVKLVIQNLKKIPIGVVSIDSTAIIELLYKGQKDKSKSIGFISRKAIFRIGDLLECEAYYIAQNYSIEITPEGLWGVATISDFQYSVIRGIGITAEVARGILDEYGITQPELKENTFRIEFIFEKRKAHFSKLLLGKYELDLTSSKIR